MFKFNLVPYWFTDRQIRQTELTVRSILEWLQGRYTQPSRKSEFYVMFSWCIIEVRICFYVC